MADRSTAIEERIERLETIAETSEDGDVNLATTKGPPEEGDEHLHHLRDEFDVSDGDIIEPDTKHQE